MGPVTDEELAAALDGLHAHDIGCSDSGIHDEALRERVKAELARPHSKARLAYVTRDLFLTDDAIGEGYGLEDLVEFIEWLKEDMGVSFQ